MTPRIDESDILALVEGELPAERRAAMGEALRTNPELRRRVEGMIRDAQALAHDHTDPPRAPANAVSIALERARVSTPDAATPVRTRRRYAMAAIITLAMVGVWGAILYATFGPTGDGGARTGRPEARLTVPEELVPTLARLAELEHEYNHPSIPIIDAPMVLAPEPEPEVEFAAIEPDPATKSMLDDFIKAAGAEEEALPTPILASMLAHHADAPSIGAIAQAAAEGRLKIVVADLDSLNTLAGKALGVFDALAPRVEMLAPDGHAFSRDYAKPDPDREAQPIVREREGPTAARVDVALVDEDASARAHAAARALELLMSEWRQAHGSDVDARFVVLEHPIEGMGPTPAGAAPDDAFWSTLPEGSFVSGVLIELEPALPE